MIGDLVKTISPKRRCVGLTKREFVKIDVKI